MIKFRSLLAIALAVTLLAPAGLVQASTAARHQVTQVAKTKAAAKKKSHKKKHGKKKHHKHKKHTSHKTASVKKA